MEYMIKATKTGEKRGNKLSEGESAGGGPFGIVSELLFEKKPCSGTSVASNLTLRWGVLCAIYYRGNEKTKIYRFQKRLDYYVNKGNRMLWGVL
jgi:hypothetical protein